MGLKSAGHDCLLCAKTMIVADNGLRLGQWAIQGLRHLVKLFAHDKRPGHIPGRLRDHCLWLLEQKDEDVIRQCFTHWRLLSAWNREQFSRDIQGTPDDELLF